LDDASLPLKTPSAAELKIKKSRFLAKAFPCRSQEEAEAEISVIRKRYHDATHNCFAYRLIRPNREELFRYSDDGEPSGTAGRPLYDCLISFKLWNSGVVVTRYFGGIKLGTGGLARAYATAARGALQTAQIHTAFFLQNYHLRFPLQLTSLIQRILSQFGATIASQDYSDRGEITFSIRRSLAEKIRLELIAKSNAKIEIEKYADNG